MLHGEETMAIMATSSRKNYLSFRGKRGLVGKVVSLACLLMLLSSLVPAQDDYIAFDSDRWIMRDAEVTEYLGRPALHGFAYIKDVEFENGIIEVDVAVDGSRSYPGIFFRMQSEQTYEHFYIRPHRMGRYSDALQYTPNINGISGWQLYNGDGYTNSIDLPKNQWVHLRLEIKGTQARLFIDNAEQPALVMNRLQIAPANGTIALQGPKDQSAYFSNFRYEITDTLEFVPASEIETPPGIFKDWEISKAFRASEIDFEKPYDKQNLPAIEWQNIQCEPSGMINLSRYMGRSGPETDCIWARTTLSFDKAQTKELKFGYSDGICIFLNGEILFSGNSAYQLRDPSFLGIIGLNDAVYLPLRKGENELLLLVAESFGGWGFICQDGNYVYMDENLTRLWEMPRQLRMPESVVYDSKRDVLYVSNYFNGGSEFISKITPGGEIVEREWITDLVRPTGMCIHDDKLYVVERMGVAEIDLDSNKISIKYPIAGGVFPNDIAVDNSGNFYITDTRINAIHKLTAGQSEIWLRSDQLSNPNGICIDGDRLICGISGKGSLKAISLTDKTISDFVVLGNGANPDGISPDGKGNYIVSDFNGRVFFITGAGEKTEILNTSVSESHCADLVYIADKGLIIIPSLYENNLTAYRLETF